MTTAVTTPKERPVFVATGDRRARGLRYAAVLAVVLACVWLVALVVGMLGFGRLPGASLPLRSSSESAERDSGAHAETAVSPSSPDVQAASAPSMISRRADTASKNATVVSRKKQRGHAGSANARRPTPEPAVPAAPAQAAPPAPVAPTPTTGWARRGVTAPPGQTTRVKAEPPGQTRREAAADPTTVPATPVTPPAPPGQQKKAEEPTP